MSGIVPAADKQSNNAIDEWHVRNEVFAFRVESKMPLSQAGAYWKSTDITKPPDHSENIPANAMPSNVQIKPTWSRGVGSVLAVVIKYDKPSGTETPLQWTVKSIYSNMPGAMWLYDGAGRDDQLHETANSSRTLNQLVGLELYCPPPHPSDDRVGPFDAKELLDSTSDAHIKDYDRTTNVTTAFTPAAIADAKTDPNQTAALATIRGTHSATSAIRDEILAAMIAIHQSYEIYTSAVSPDLHINKSNHVYDADKVAELQVYYQANPLLAVNAPTYVNA